MGQTTVYIFRKNCEQRNRGLSPFVLSNVEVTSAVRIYRAAPGGSQGYAACAA